MKILLFTQYFWPENFSINDLAISLTEKGHYIEVLTGKPNYPQGRFYKGYNFFYPHKEKYKKIIINRIPTIPRFRKSKFGLFLNYLSFIFFGIFLAPLIFRKKKFDLIFIYAPSPITQAIPASFLGFLKKIPVVLWVQDLWPDSVEATGYIKNKFLINILALVVKVSYFGIDLVLIPSKKFKNNVSKFYSKKIIYYPNSVSKKYVNKFLTKNELPEVFNNGFNILFAGNIGRAQSISTIIETAELLKDHGKIKILVAGYGSELRSLLTNIKNKKIKNLYYLGSFEEDFMPFILRASDVLMITLKNEHIFNNTIPNKIQAYLASGKPIVASVNGEAASLLKKSGAALVVRSENAYELSKSIIHLYKMTPSHLKLMGKRGKNYYLQNYDHDMLVDKLISLLKKFINS